MSKKRKKLNTDAMVVLSKLRGVPLLTIGKATNVKEGVSVVLVEKKGNPLDDAEKLFLFLATCTSHLTYAVLKSLMDKWEKEDSTLLRKLEKKHKIIFEVEP